jgi:hypothetical protein
MNAVIAHLYDEWFQKTGDPNAAATLVLAQVQSGQHDVRVDEEPTYNPTDIAKRLHVSPAKVIGWIRCGELKAANIASGHRPRFIIKQSDFDFFLENRQLDQPTARKRGKLRTTSKRF